MKKDFGKIICFLLFIGLTSCQRQSTLTFNLQNLSKDNKDVTIKVKVGDNVIYEDKLLFNPDTSAFLTISKDIPIGKYVINVAADNGIVTETNPVIADLDQTIFISYRFNALDTIKEKVLHNGDTILIARYADKKDAKLNIKLAIHK